MNRALRLLLLLTTIATLYPWLGVGGAVLAGFIIFLFALVLLGRSGLFPLPMHQQPRLLAGYAGPVVLLAKGSPLQRCLARHEIGMGGPESETWLLADGALIDGVSSGWYSFDQGRYLAAVTDVREHRYGEVYDSAEHRLYGFEASNAHLALQALGPPDVPMTPDTPASTRQAQQPNPLLQQLLAGASAVPLVPFHGLWLRPDRCPKTRPDVLHPVGLNGLKLSARLCLPQDLRYAHYPVELAEHPPYEVYIDDQPTGHYVLDFDHIAATPDAASLVFKGVLLNQYHRIADGVWHILHRQQWQAVLSYVTRPYAGGGYYSTYSLKQIASISSEQVEFEIEIDTSHSAAELPLTVNLLSTNTPEGLLLPIHNNRITVKFEKPSNAGLVNWLFFTRR